MKGQTAREGMNIEHGVYEAVLQEINIYTATAYKSDELQINVTLVWDLGENENGEPERFYDSFITIPFDKHGPIMSGSKSKLYNRLSALHGARFDPKTVDWELLPPEGHDTVETIFELPSWDAYKRDEPRAPADILIDGESVVGKQAQIEIGNAKKPDGTLSDRTSIVNANPMPKTRRAATKTAATYQSTKAPL